MYAGWLACKWQFPVSMVLLLMPTVVILRPCAVLLCCHRFCYNANSKDTGGLVGDDWQTLVWRKLTW
mgnify:FL=1